MNRKWIFILSVIVLLLISSCSGRVDEMAMATTEAEAILEAASGTASAMQTQIALENPTATISPTPLPTNTPLPATNTPIPTLPPVATDAPVTGGTGSTSSACDAAAFISETVPDNSIYAPGTVFVKTWTIRNSGTCTWSPSYTLVHHSEQKFGVPDSNVISSVSVAPGSTLDVSLTMTAPSEPGTYYSHWQLKNANGETFLIGGTTLWAKIVVSSDASTATQGTPIAQTATITPTTFGTVVYTSTPIPQPTKTFTPVVIVVTATFTPVPPTNTPVPPTNTPVPSSSTEGGDTGGASS